MSSSSEVIKEHTFKWKIVDYSLCMKTKGEYFQSPVFRVESLHNTSWFLRLYPRGNSSSKEGYVGCYLVRSEIDDGDLEIESEISIISSDGSVLQSNNIARKFKKGEAWGWPNFWKTPTKSLLHTNDDLLVRCKLKSSANKTPICFESSGVTSFDSDFFSFRMIVNILNSKCSRQLFYNETSQIEICIETHNEDIKITIRRIKEDTEPLSVLCRINLLDVKGGKHDSKEALHLFETKDPSIENDTWQFPNFLKKSKLNSEKEKYLKGDCFTLLCNIVISNGAQIDSVEYVECDSSVVDLSPPDRSTITVLEDYKRLYRDKIHADVKLHVDGQIIQAHKNILSIRSPVFFAMFDSGMIENKTGSVTVPDLDAETVNTLLEYIYTGTVEKLDYDIATKLIVGADKYQVLSLKEKCAQFMKSIMAQANVCETLMIADLVQHEVLKDAAVNYIKENSQYIFLSEEWDSVVERNFKLATVTFSKVSKLMAADRKKLENK